MRYRCYDSVYSTMKIKKKFGFSQILAYTNTRKTTTWICYWQKQSSVMLCSSLASRNIGFILIYLYMCQNKVVMSELAFVSQAQFCASCLKAYRIQTQQIQNIYIIMILQVKTFNHGTRWIIFYDTFWFIYKCLDTRWQIFRYSFSS